MLLILRYNAVGRTAGDAGELPFIGARSQNIENNPMQSSRRPAWRLRNQVDTSGKSPAVLHHRELGEQLMANALGVADREAMHGIIRQLVKASVSGESPDEVNLSFMISMVKSIKPRDSIEAMLVAQMVSVHVMAMRCAHHLANADDLAQHDSAARPLGRLPRPLPAPTARSN